ncbi:putative iron-sulfur cluster assembly protein [Mitosporidium daphniae]|uniref:Putative iron-sulfur cluster assembly protein n=1 Tax=Mitosporidium daphniae TaxID=1485682 RepID=A0A098VWN7_9MICR|nr:putative iron-sulfur cluster assembly protein [Mitosporidium daphniae]KGG52171.1 putative iron-sulfur cluster assembly protein [Mitosporidium daphniae]|eukprot:XP_013238598.1 putative iron-sulfur cluster assembly protein [Mitosporidium daphniae]
MVLCAGGHLKNARAWTLLRQIRPIQQALLSSRSTISKSIRICAPDSPNTCFVVTKSAFDKLKEIKSSFHSGLHLKVDVGGCHGFQYLFSLQNIATIDSIIDDAQNREGGLIVIDRKSLDLIKDSTLDYSRELIGSKFIITDNSRVEDPCGCGVSFGLRK